MTYEWSFLDGPGKGRAVFNDEAPVKLWLCKGRSKRWWTFHKPEKMWIEATYQQIGNAPRLDGGPILIVYEVTDGEPDEVDPIDL